MKKIILYSLMLLISGKSFASTYDGVLNSDKLFMDGHKDIILNINNLSNKKSKSLYIDHILRKIDINFGLVGNYQIKVRPLNQKLEYDFNQVKNGEAITEKDIKEIICNSELNTVLLKNNVSYVFNIKNLDTQYSLEHNNYEVLCIGLIKNNVLEEKINSLDVKMEDKEAQGKENILNKEKDLNSIKENDTKETLIDYKKKNIILNNEKIQETINNINTLYFSANENQKKLLKTVVAEKIADIYSQQLTKTKIGIKNNKKINVKNQGNEVLIITKANKNESLIMKNNIRKIKKDEISQKIVCEDLLLKSMLDIGINYKFIYNDDKDNIIYQENIKENSCVK